MSLVSDTVIDLSDLCPDLEHLYQKLKPHMTVRLRKYIPEVGYWDTIFSLKEDELVVIREGTDLSVTEATIEGSLADLHSRITKDRLLVILTYSDYIHLSVLWRLLVETSDLEELMEKLDQHVPHDKLMDPDEDLYDDLFEVPEPPEDLSLEELRAARLRHFSVLVT